MQLTKKLQASFGRFKHLFCRKTQLLSVALVVLFCNFASHAAFSPHLSAWQRSEPASISKRNELPWRCPTTTHGTRAAARERKTEEANKAAAPGKEAKELEHCDSRRR
jgi:hypothetical protein